MADLFVDPGQEFLTRAELTQVENVASANSNTMGKVSMAIAAAFPVYLGFMKRKIRKDLEGRKPNEINLIKAMNTAHAMFKGNWVRMILPHLVSGYVEGLKEARAGKVPPEYLYSVAEKYAESLGEHISNVTTEAVLSGYRAQVNRKVAANKAMERSLEAMGVPPKAMNALVSVWTTEDPKVLTDGPTTSHKDNRAKTLIKAELDKRGSQIGEAESWNAKEQAKQVVWMYSQEKGIIPKATKRRWKTAKDERVCPSCGPMDNKAIKVSDQFRMPDGKMLWSPPVHVNCRCTVELAVTLTAQKATQIAQELSKARGDDPYARDNSGQFAEKESRTAKPKPGPKLGFKERPKVDPLVASVLQGINFNSATKADVDQALEQQRTATVTPTASPTATSTAAQTPKATLSPKATVTPKATISPKAKFTPKAEIRPKAVVPTPGAPSEAQATAATATSSKATFSAPTEQAKATFTNLLATVTPTPEETPASDKWRPVPLSLVTVLTNIISHDEMITGRHEVSNYEMFGDQGRNRFIAGDEQRFHTVDLAMGSAAGGDVMDEVREHWINAMEIETDRFRDGMEYPSVMDWSGHYLEVSEDAFAMAFHYAATQQNGLELIELYSVEDGSVHEIPVAAISEFYLLDRVVNLHIPVIAVTNHINIDNQENDIGYGRHALTSNPGEWRQAGEEIFADRTFSDSNDPLLYRMIRFDPAELYDD